MRLFRPFHRLGSRQKPGRVSKNERGQVSIFIGSMLLTFFLLFTFVINTGMLVNAKINLQNAADLAAYAGASVQARQLNDIGYLNYEMRRVFKKFLFRYYVIGNATQPSFPGLSGQSSGPAQFQVAEYTPGGPSGARKNIGVPSTCVTFLPNDNFCQIANLPPIPNPATGPVATLDTIMGALSEQLTKLEGIRKKGCIGIGQMNQMLMFYWLWNTDPDLRAVTAKLAAAGGDAEYIQRLQVLQALANGLGLIPREIFLRKRIDTLSRYINAQPRSGVNIQAAMALKSSNDWAMNERTVQAFLSAYHTLGGSTFPDEGIEMDEVLPEGGDGANLIALKDITAEFDAFATDFAINNSDVCKPDVPNRVGDEIAERNQGCIQCLVSYTQSEEISGYKPIVGVAKDPQVLTYYAIRLQAKAKLLFSPFGDLTLTAYSAAQPFGSRIGPPEAEAQFTAPGAPANGVFTRCNNITCIGRIPNLPMKANDPIQPNLQSGWAQNDILYHLYRGAFSTAGGAIRQSIGVDDLKLAYHIAMAPNPWERGRYLIPNDANDDPFLKTFDSKGIRAIWAPLFTGSSTSANANPAAEIIGFMNQQATKLSTQSAAVQNIITPEAQAALISQISHYVNTALKDGKGEDGEGLNVVRIVDPIHTRFDLAGRLAPLAPGIPNTILMREANNLKTGWNEVLANEYKSSGRSGYSVKYVPLNTLRSASNVTTNGSESFTNRLPASGTVGNEILEMKH